MFEDLPQADIGILRHIFVFVYRAVLFSCLTAECLQVAVGFCPVTLSELGGAFQKIVFPMGKLAVDGVPRVAYDAKEADIDTSFHVFQQRLQAFRGVQIPGAFVKHHRSVAVQYSVPKSTERFMGKRDRNVGFGQHDCYFVLEAAKQP